MGNWLDWVFSSLQFLLQYMDLKLFNPPRNFLKYLNIKNNQVKPIVALMANACYGFLQQQNNVKTWEKFQTSKPPNSIFWHFCLSLICSLRNKVTPRNSILILIKVLQFYSFTLIILFLPICAINLYWYQHLDMPEVFHGI